VSRVLYRIAAALIVLLGVGHSSGYPWSDPAWGVDLHTIQSSHFDVLGSSRTYWHFYIGFGLSVSVLLLLPAVTAWQLSNASDQRPRRITAWVLVLSFAVITLLDCMFFFMIPIVLSAAITLCLITATLLAPPPTRIAGKQVAASVEPARTGTS
jgi:hypothetical protein